MGVCLSRDQRKLCYWLQVIDPPVNKIIRGQSADAFSGLPASKFIRVLKLFGNNFHRVKVYKEILSFKNVWGTFGDRFYDTKSICT